MADIDVRGHRGQPSRDARGQLLLVGALGLAVLFVALALVLNTAIFTENLATGGSDVDGHDAAAFEDDVRRGTADLVAYVNRHNNSSYADAESALQRGTADWDELSARESALDGRATTVDLRSTTRGTHIAQDEGSRNFTNRSGAADWTLATGVSNTRQFRLNVSSGDLLQTCGLLGECFRVTATDGRDTWRASVYRDATGDVVVRVVDPDGSTETCTASGAWVVVDLTAGTVGGADCPALDFADGVSTPYAVEYANGDESAGTYELVVGTAVPSDPHYATDGSPHASPAVYAATVGVAYEHAQLRYETDIRVAPGEADD